MMKKIIEPTLLLDKRKCLHNIEAMVNKAKRSNVIFRPHFKTHQSREIGRWFRNFGVDCITVSSLKMAQYFAADGWKDISVAFPANIREIDRINELAGKITLNVLVESPVVVSQLKNKLTAPVNVFLKIDVGYHRTGIAPENFRVIDEILSEIESADLMTFKGFLTHAGHSYHAKSKADITKIHNNSVQILNWLKNKYKTYPEVILSIGDTPTCSIVDDLTGIDEIRPGNFVFYDVMQWNIGSCRLDQIAVAMVCPVVAKHSERNEIVIYGGAVHFSKECMLTPEGEKCFGLLVELNQAGWIIPQKPAYLKSLSQEHGILKVKDDIFEKIHEGDLVSILPIHSCLTGNLMKSYLTLDGDIISRL